MRLWILPSVLLSSTLFFLASAQIAPSESTEPQKWGDLKAYPLRGAEQDCPPFNILKPSTLTNFWNGKVFVQSKRAGISLANCPNKGCSSEKGGDKGTEYQVDCWVKLGT
jgi:hypothetical protein